MRTLVEPPPSSQCDLCGGELRLKLIEPANRTLDIEPANRKLNLDNEILVYSATIRMRTARQSR